VLEQEGACEISRDDEKGLARLMSLEEPPFAPILSGN